MKKYILRFEYCYIKDQEIEFVRNSRKEAIDYAKEYLRAFASPITGQPELVEVGEIIDLI